MCGRYKDFIDSLENQLANVFERAALAIRLYDRSVGIQMSSISDAATWITRDVHCGDSRPTVPAILSAIIRAQLCHLQKSHQTEESASRHAAACLLVALMVLG